MKFFYKARHKHNNDVIEGYVDAKDEKSAVAMLLNQDLIPIEVSSRHQSSSPSSSEIKAYTNLKDHDVHHAYNLKEYIFLFKNLADLLEAGFSLMQSLEMVIKECRNEKFTHLLERVKDRVAEGELFSDALTQFPNAFPSYFVSLIKASELNGQTVGALHALSQEIEKKWRLQKTIMQALFYPLVIFLMGIVAVVVLMVFVLPRIASLFTDFDVLLPLSTRIVMGASDFLLSYGVFIILFLLGSGFALTKMWKDEATRFSLDRKILSIPFFGRFFMLVDMSRFFRVLGISIENGVDLVVAFRSSLGVLRNSFLKQEFSNVLIQVKDGSKLSAGFKNIDYFPDSFYGLIAMGEQKATLGKDFIKIANNYDEEVQEYSQKCVDLIGPIVLVMVVAFVGVVLISVMMPILQMNMSL